MHMWPCSGVDKASNAKAKDLTFKAKAKAKNVSLKAKD
jgi:hypothetical protein